MLTTVSHNGIDVDYAYDGQGRILETKIAGSAIVSNVYTDGTTATGVDTVTATYANGTVIKTTTDSRGRTTRVEDIANGVSTQVLQYTYDGTTDRPTAVTDGIGNISYSYSYTDGKLDQTSYNVHAKNVLLKDTYNADNLLVNSKIIIGYVPGQTYDDTSEQYAYTYDDTPEHNLAAVKLPNGITQKLTRDALGRTHAISQSINGKALTDENRYYLKYGDRTTDNISSVRFGVNGSLDEHIRYKYDKSGNISEIYKNGMLTNRYVYDKLNRMVREDNKEMGYTYVFAYDVGGNILSKSVYEFTLGLLAEKTPVSVIPYSYKATGWRDQMTAFNGQKCEYDIMGRPTTYRNKKLVWSRYGTLLSYDHANFTYDANGVRLTKAYSSMTKFYISGTKILQMTFNGHVLRFRYGVSGVQGFNYDENEYIYIKNILGDVTHIYKLINDDTIELVAEYKYDAWGNHEVQNHTEDKIGDLNPIRYRSYFYDRETRLYYLNSRYYDPETGRFISADDTQFLEPNTVNGLNLYAYCGNNPVMNVDPSGHFAITALIIAGLIGGAILGGAVSGIKASNEGQSGWGLFGAIAGGAFMGAVMGGLLALGGGVGAAAALGTTATIGSITMTSALAVGVSVIGGAIAGMGAYSLENGLRTDKTWSLGGFFKSGLTGMAKGLMTFGIGYAAGYNGAYDKPFLKEMFDDKIGVGLGRAVISAIFKSSGRNLLTKSSIIFGDFITKLILVSSAAAGVRRLIDILFGE